jgi:hypothetical protein
MRIAQRGTSFTGLQNTPTYSIDRMSYRRGGTWTTATFSHTQDTDVPTGQGFNNSLKFSCTATETPTTDQNAYILGIYNEGINFSHLAYGTPNAKTMTLTFWVKSNVTGTYQINFGTTRRLYKTYTIDTADTWEKKTITFAGDTSASIANDTSVGFLILWEAAAGPDVGSGTPTGEWEAPNSTNDAALHQVNLASSTSNYVNITGVQLEVGDTATPFEVMPYDMQLARCERYYQKSYDVNITPGTINTNGPEVFQIDDGAIQRSGVRWRIRTRTSPTVTIYNPATGASGQIRTDAAQNYNVGNAYYIGQTGCFIDYTPASGQYVSFHWVASAEL